MVQIMNAMVSKLSCLTLGTTYDFALADFPNTMQIETTNACNAECVTCPHPAMNRTIKHMDDELFAKIIDECATHDCGDVQLHNFGEPFLDKKLTKRISYAKQKGLKKVKIFSNGSLIDSKKANELIDAGLDEIKISFDGSTKEEFERIRYPLQFDQLILNINELIRLRNERKSPLKIKVTCCSTSDKSETIKTLENIADEFSFDHVHNWGGQIEDADERTSIRKACHRVWRTFTVLSNGDVALCCLDYEGKVVLGNARNTSIYEIWHNPLYEKMRHYHKTGQQQQVSICNNCSKSFW